MDGPRILRPDGAAITAAREGAKLSKYRLAKVLGRSRSTITDLENGRRNATRPLLADIAQACGVPVESLVVANEPTQGATTPAGDDSLPGPQVRREDRPAREPATEEVLEVPDAALTDGA